MISPNPVESRDLFLCHSKTDADWVCDLAERIEQEEWDGRRLRVAFDEWDVHPGSNVVSELGRLLDASRFVAVVMSPELLDSEWATMEWTSAVYSDPAGLRRRVLPLRLRDHSLDGERRIEVPVPLRVLNRFDFRRPASFPREYARLLSVVRGEPLRRTRGRSAATTRTPVEFPRLSADESAPDQVTESLLSNLLPVVSAPTRIWGSDTHVRSRSDVWAEVSEPDRSSVPPFIVKERRIYSFADPHMSPNPLRALTSPSSDSNHTLVDWAGDEDRRWWVTELFHAVLNDHARREVPLRYDHTTKRHFFAPVFSAGARRKRMVQKRTVAKPCEQGDSVAFWIHHGCRLRFERVGGAYFLRLEPCYVATTDGLQPMRGRDVGPLTMKWASRERNAAILRHVLFWGQSLASRRAQIRMWTGGDDIVLSPIPAWSEASVGLSSDTLSVRALDKPKDGELDRAASLMMAAEDEPDDE